MVLVYQENVFTADEVFPDKTCICYQKVVLRWRNVKNKENRYKLSFAAFNVR